jgi:hypothetical protein
MLAPKPQTCFAAGTLLKIFILQTDTRIARALSELQAALLSSSLPGLCLKKFERE